jgi:hypothetical protein
MKFDVAVNISIRVKARDGRAAESHILEMLDNHFSQMLDSPAVVGTSVPLTPNNPHAEPVRKKRRAA